MEQLNEEDLQRLWELYVVSCQGLGVEPSVRDFMVWWGEEYAFDEV